MQTSILAEEKPAEFESNHPTIHLGYKANSEGFRVVELTWEDAEATDLGVSVRLGVA